MLSGAAIRHLTSQHDLPQDDITAARFHFSRCSWTGPNIVCGKSMVGVAIITAGYCDY